MLIGVTADKAALYWPMVSKWVEDGMAFSDGKFSLDSIKDSILRRDMQLWVEDDLSAACVTQIAIYPRRKVCVVNFAGGATLEVYLEGMKVIERWAKQNGCGAVEVIGRKGWEKVLKDFDVIHTVIRKRL